MQIFPQRAFFRPNEIIKLIVRRDVMSATVGEIIVYHLGVTVHTQSINVTGLEASIDMVMSLPTRSSYLVQITLDNQQDWTAFDVLESWSLAPRYGYLFDFQPHRPSEDMQDTLEHLLKLHVNGLQFYDWQYRHDTLVPPQDVFDDPLGRPLSLAIVRHLIEKAHALGMVAMPYTAIYAASPSFADNHLEWALYDDTHQVVDFADGFLKIMNMDSGWRDHFVRECVRVVEQLPFDGIHVDQYGEPRSGFDNQGVSVDIAQGFHNTLAQLRQALPADKVLLFNLVHNYPVDVIADSPIDFWYSEIWPPITEIRQLWQTIRDNQRLNDRPQVIAVYIPPQWETTLLAAHCTILAAGGSHIAHGDHRTWLSDPYFPKAQVASATLQHTLQRIANFAVAYEETTVFAQDVTEQWIARIQVNGHAWKSGNIIVKQTPSALYIHILPITGHWTEELAMPAPLSILNLTIDGQPTSGWYASPTHPVPQVFETTLTSFNYWLLVCISLKENPYG